MGRVWGGGVLKGDQEREVGSEGLPEYRGAGKDVAVSR